MQFVYIGLPSLDSRCFQRNFSRTLSRFTLGNPEEAKTDLQVLGSLLVSLPKKNFIWMLMSLLQRT